MSLRCGSPRSWASATNVTSSLRAECPRNCGRPKRRRSSGDEHALALEQRVVVDGGCLPVHAGVVDAHVAELPDGAVALDYGAGQDRVERGRQRASGADRGRAGGRAWDRVRIGGRLNGGRLVVARTV